MGLSVVIPTLLKDINILENLLNILNNDNCVSEIILINNSTKAYKSNIKKLRIINPSSNLYVNPSWNLGVKEAKEEYFALFNDDLLVCENFCTQCINAISKIEHFGCMGISSESVINSKDLKIPELNNIFIEEDKEERCENWGIIIFGKKSFYTPIPDDIKVWCGDDFIRYMTLKSNNKIFKLKGTSILHLGSLSSSDSKLDKIKFYDIMNYAKINKNFKNTWIYKRYKKKYIFHYLIKNYFKL